MRILALLFLVGFASASFYDVLDDAADEIVREFLIGMENGPSLKDALGLTDTQAADEVEDEIKTELGKSLKDALNNILEKIKDAIDHGHTVKEELLKKVKELKEQLKDIHMDIGDKAKELLGKIKEKAKDFLKKILEKLGLDGDKQERSLDEIDVILESFSVRELFKKLKEAILSKIDKEALKAKIEELFGKGSEMADQLLVMLKEKGEKYKQKILDFIDNVLEDKNREERSLTELWEKVKEHFEKLKITITEKYLKFGEWVRETIKKGLEASKSKIENLKQIAKQLKEHIHEVGKDIAVEGLEFLRPYKEDLGALWDQLKEAVSDMIKVDKLA